MSCGGLFGVVELIAEGLYSLLRWLMVPLIIVLRGAVRSHTWGGLGCHWTPYWASIKWSLVTLKYWLRCWLLEAFFWRTCLRNPRSARVIIWLFCKIRWTLLMLILLSQGSNFLTLSFEAWKNCIWINIFFLFISCFRSLSNWLLVHHWRLRWKTFGSVIGSWYTVILWRVHIWLSRWSTWWWYSYLSRSFFLLILPWSHASRLIGILVRLKFILRSIMIHSSLKIIIASVNVFW